MNTRQSLVLIVLVTLLLACSFPLTGRTGVEIPEQTGVETEESGEEIAPPETTQPTAPAVYYVRPDGGSAEQCSGLEDAAYLSSGSNQPCAWNHPFQALPPLGTAHIAGGSTLIIAAGSYRIGFGAPGAEACEAEGAFDCLMAPIPSGPDPEHPTRILGVGWDAGCPAPPELWGAERANFVLNLTGSSNVEVACLEITDHSDCVDEHTGGLACQRDRPPFGDWAAVGLHAEDSANVYLHHLNIHGLSGSGIHAGRLTDWTVEDVRIAANGWAGWDGDLWDDFGDENHGTLTFRRMVIEWNGCAETYPGGEPTGCWAQEAGGYGDGFGPGASGADWIIEDSSFLHNTSDGIDMLYHQLGGSILINRVHSEGNAGNQIKVTGNTQIINSVLVGNCSFFDGQPFTFNVDPCRAYGNTLHIAYTGGEHVTITNTTFYGQGDGLIGAGPREDQGQCDGSETLTGSNNIFLGDKDYFDPTDITFLFYQEGCGDLRFEGDYNLAYNVRNIETQWVDPPFPDGHNLFQDPLLAGPFSGLALGMYLLPESPAIDAGDSAACPDVDIRGSPRPVDGNSDGQNGCDMGAYEIQ
jgi:hypothetical protein